jgi:hypothetical protein
VWSASSGGSILYDESLSVTIEDGYYAVTLGATPGDPLASSVFAAPTWMEVEIDGTVLGGRQPILGAPRAAAVSGGITLDPPAVGTCAPDGAIAYDAPSQQVKVCVAGSFVAIGGKKTVVLDGLNRRWSRPDLCPEL